MEKVAVILPVYIKDSPLWLNDAVSSIIHQTYKDIKLFVGLDGPSTNEQNIVLEGFSRQPNVKVVHFDENRGMAAVLNDLLVMAFAEGYEYIARMDADDISLPERITKQMAFLAEHPDVDVISGSVLIIDAEGKDKGKVLSYPESHEGCIHRFAKRNPLAHPAVLFRKRYFDKAGCLYRPEFRKNQDTLLWYDGLIKGVKMGNVQDVVLKFRSTEDMLKNRRGGKDAAKKQLKARLMINKGLRYGFFSDVYAYAIYLLMISPTFVRKILYSIQ